MAVINPALASILAAQQTAKAAPGVVAAPVTPAPVVAAGGPSPMPAISPILDPAAGLADPTILGMTPEQFTAIVGGIGQALAPADTWQSRLGAFAKSIGQGQIVGGLTGEDIEGSKLTPKKPEKPKTPTKAAAKSKLAQIPKVDLDLSNTLLGG